MKDRDSQGSLKRQLGDGSTQGGPSFRLRFAQLIPILTMSPDGGPIALCDGHDLPGLVDEGVPSVAAVIDDVVEGFEGFDWIANSGA